MDGNIVKAVFEPGSTRASAAGLWQWDYGQILQIEGITGLPAAPEVHFEQAGISKTGIGSVTDDICTVSIPDVLLQRSDRLTAYIYLHAGEDDGETEYQVRMMIRARAVPESFKDSQEYDALVQATKMLDTATTRAGEIAAEATEAKEAAQASQTAAKASEDAAAKSASEADTSAKSASEAETQTLVLSEAAASSAKSAADSEAEAKRLAEVAEKAEASATTSAAAAAESQKAAAESEANAKKSEEAAQQSEVSASTSKADAEASAKAAATSEETATTKASEASASAAAAATSETNAKTSAESAAESKAAAEASKAAAETAAANAKTSETNAKASEEAAAQSAKDSAVAAVELNVMTTIDGTNTTRVWRAYKEAMAGTPMERYALLSRFCELLGVAWSDKTYGLKWYDETISGETSMTPIADLAGKEAAQLCTETTEPVEDWADEDPMTWYVRGNALSLADGTMNITAFEGEEGFDITGETAPVYTFAMSLYKKVENDGEYNYKYFRTAPADGFKPMAGDIAPDGTFRPLSWRPTFSGGVTSDGKLSSGAGLPPAIYWSAVTGNTKAKLWNDYEGLWTDCATIWLLDMWQLRHFNVENSGICEGCTYYYADYTAAVSETGVKRVLLTASQASYLIVNSSVSVGASARASSNVLAQIESITDETVDGTAYKAVNLAVDETFDTTAGTTYLSTMPWFGGMTEYLPGHKDGCYHNLTGKGVARIAGVECLNGAYQLQLDPLYNVTDVTTSSAVYELYVQRDSEKLSASTSGYTKVASVTTPITAGWSYIKRLLANDEVFFPDMFGGSSSTWLKSSFYRSGSAGVWSPWRFGILYLGGFAGLAFLAGGNSPHGSGWDGSPRLGDSGKKRGELA